MVVPAAGLSAIVAEHQAAVPVVLVHAAGLKAAVDAFKIHAAETLASRVSLPIAFCELLKLDGAVKLMTD